MAANLLEKQDRRRPDPYHTIPLLSRGRTAVYSVWLICNELDKGSFEDLYAGPSAVFDELAADGLDLIGAPCAAALRTAKERISDMEGHAGRTGRAARADFLEAAEEERPLDRCVEYIRANPREFVDQSPDSFRRRGASWPRDRDREDPAARWILAGLAGKRQDIDEMEEVYDHHTQRTLFTAKRRLPVPTCPPAFRNRKSPPSFSCISEYNLAAAPRMVEHTAGHSFHSVPAAVPQTRFVWRENDEHTP